MREKNNAGGLRNNISFNNSVQANTDFLNDLKDKLPEFFTADRYDESGELVEAGFFDWVKFKNQFDENGIQDELTSGYQLDFIGKNYARQQAGERPTTVIVPDKEHNEKPENANSKNLFFTGDNLEVLRHLQANYQNSVDFIYIDPPYNTGTDGFVYPDTFDYTDDQLMDMFGIDDDEVKRLKSIQGKATHSAWLTFMYPRLYLAKKLLKDTGVIFVSIDDNEQANLKLLMDEIFGENIEQFIWNKEAEGKSGKLKRVSRFRNVHEYVLAGYRNVNNVEFNKIREALVGKENEVQTANLAVNADRENTEHENYFTITNPSGDSFTRQWKWNKEKIDELIKDDLIFWGSDGHKQPRLIIPTDDRRTTYLESILNYGGTTSGRKDFESTMEEGLFSYPKPVILIKKLIETATSKNSIIMDFFAGSSTTADAVMQLNAEDGGNRQFIMATLPEPTYSTNADGTKVPTKGGETAFNAGYASIDEISRERINRVASKIKEENPLLAESQDLGFKHYRMVSPSIETLDKLEYSEDLQLDLFDDMLTPFSSQGLGVGGVATGFDTILSTWLVADGYRFDSEVSSVKFGNYEAPYVENTRVYIINNGWGAENTKALVNAIGTNQLVVQTIVVYGYEIDMESLRELEQALSVLENRVNLIVRY